MVDIRGNGGGDSDAKNELLSYLVKSKLSRKADTRALIRTVKLPEELLPYSNTWVEAVKKGLPKRRYKPFNDTYYELKGGGSSVSIAPKKQAFKGQVYIFGDGSNTSATYTMLMLAKNYGFATFIGSESGGNLQGINGSQYVFFYLPYSRMEVDIPLIYSQPTASMPDRGVKPDIEVKMTQRAIALGRDPFLEALR
jgi:C-terminal processing protease CtpA/Prc